jgi:hypothetical protein
MSNLHHNPFDSIHLPDASLYKINLQSLGVELLKTIVNFENQKIETTPKLNNDNYTQIET